MHVPFQKQAGSSTKRGGPCTLPAQPTALPLIDTPTCLGMCGMYSTSGYTYVCVKDNGQAQPFALKGLHLAFQAHAQSQPAQSKAQHSWLLCRPAATTQSDMQNICHLVLSRSAERH